MKKPENKLLFLIMHLIKAYLNDYVLKKHDGDLEYLFSFVTIRYMAVSIRYMAVSIRYTTVSIRYTIVSIRYTIVFISYTEMSIRYK